MFNIGKKTLDSILAGFTKTITDLESLVAANNVKIAANGDEVMRLEDEVDALFFEAQQAGDIAERLRSLVA